MSMFAMKYDDLMRKMRADGITLKKIDTVYETTPEFEALWAAYVENDDPLYNICTEDDGRTHTFYRIYLPNPPQPVTSVIEDNHDTTTITTEDSNEEHDEDR